MMIDMEENDGVVRLTLNRPEARNALNSKGMAQLCDAFAETAQNRDARVLAVSYTHLTLPTSIQV